MSRVGRDGDDKDGRARNARRLGNCVNEVLLLVVDVVEKIGRVAYNGDGRCNVLRIGAAVAY